MKTGIPAFIVGVALGLAVGAMVCPWATVDGKPANLINTDQIRGLSSIGKDVGKGEFKSINDQISSSQHAVFALICVGAVCSLITAIVFFMENTIPVPKVGACMGIFTFVLYLSAVIIYYVCCIKDGFQSLPTDTKGMEAELNGLNVKLDEPGMFLTACSSIFSLIAGILSCLI